MEQEIEIMEQKQLQGKEEVWEKPTIEDFAVFLSCMAEG